MPGWVAAPSVGAPTQSPFEGALPPEVADLLLQNPTLTPEGRDLLQKLSRPRIQQNILDSYDPTWIDSTNSALQAQQQQGNQEPSNRPQYHTLYEDQGLGSPTYWQDSNFNNLFDEEEEFDIGQEYY